jgi:hypothetical protein
LFCFLVSKVVSEIRRERWVDRDPSDLYSESLL